MILNTLYKLNPIKFLNLDGKMVKFYFVEDRMNKRFKDVFCNIGCLKDSMTKVIETLEMNNLLLSIFRQKIN